MVPNPWQVESIQAFYFLKCPECSFDTQDENCFQDHALENQPLSWTCALFEIKSNEDIVENSTYQEHDEDSLVSAENRNSPSQNSTIDIREEFRVDENDPLGFSNPITNYGEEFLDERNVFFYLKPLSNQKSLRIIKIDKINLVQYLSVQFVMLILHREVN